MADDAEALGDAIFESLDVLRPWLPWTANEPLTVTERRALIEQWERDWSAGASGMHRRLGPRVIEFGYWVRSSMQGRGLGARIGWVLTDAALALEGIDFVEIHHDRANRASESVPRKLGYRLVGEIDKPPDAPGEVGVELHWRMDRDTWQTHRSETARRINA
jgi:hypothetical protein